MFHGVLDRPKKDQAAINSACLLTFTRVYYLHCVRYILYGAVCLHNLYACNMQLQCCVYGFKRHFLFHFTDLQLQHDVRKQRVHQDKKLFYIYAIQLLHGMHYIIIVIQHI